MAAAAVKIVIPARLNSSRLAEKVLLPINQRPMLAWVWRAACRSQLGEVIIATDHARVAAAARAWGAQVCMTAASHVSGTDRCAEVAQQLGWDDRVRVINLQGDEPQMPAACLQQLADLSQHHDNAVTSLYQTIACREEWQDPSVVKVVCDHNGRALYFSRAAIPYLRAGAAESAPDWSNGLYRRHIGVYAYPVALLRTLTQLPVGGYEALEQLEQLRLLQAGYALYLAPACQPVPAGVDTAADWQRVAAQWSTEWA